MPIARGGQAVYGATIGILMLDARFARVPGDMGNALTWPFPVQYRVVRGASPERVVLHRAEGLLQPFLDAAADLVAHGCAAITTNCGFLSLFQRELAAHVGVPRRNQCADAGAVGAGDTAAGQARRRGHHIGRQPDPRPSPRGRRTGRHPYHRLRRWP